MDIISNVVDTSKSYRIQETPYFKRLRLREESDLVHLRQAKQIVERAAENFLEPQIRQIRLKKLYEQIQHNIEKDDGKIKRKRHTPKGNVRRERAVQAKVKGNEYSLRNRKSIPLEKLYAFRKAFNKKAEDKKSQQSNQQQQSTSFNKRKEYGNAVNEYNKLNIENQKETKSVDKDVPDYRHKNERNRKNEYGQYYTLRNRLNFKHSIKEFDEEYSDLLLQCLLFEKEHLDVCGFLEEQVRSSPSIRSKLMSKLTHSAQSSQLTISNYTSDSDLVSLNSTDTTESAVLSELPSTFGEKSKSKSRMSRSIESREIFDTLTKISKADTEKTVDSSSSSFIDTMNPVTIAEKFVWKNDYNANVNEQSSSSSDDFDVSDSLNDNQEKEIGVHKFASIIMKSSSDYFLNESNDLENNLESSSKTCINTPPKTEMDKCNNMPTESIDNDMAGPSVEQIVTKTVENDNFEEILQNIITYKSSSVPAGKFSFADELSNLFVAYGTKMMREATNGKIDQNLVKTFALKQQSSIRKAFETISTTRHF